MVLRVLGALEGASEVGARLLCGPSWTAVDSHPELREAIYSGEVQWMDNGSSPSASTHAALQGLPPESPVLVTTADHALLTPRIVETFCIQARMSRCDVVVGLAWHSEVVGAYPGVQRTVLRLREGGYCSCNLFAFLTPQGRAAAAYWRHLENRRKRPLYLLSALGAQALLRYATGRLTLTEGLECLSARLGVAAGAVILPFPEAAIDVDSVADWQLAEAVVGKSAL